MKKTLNGGSYELVKDMMKDPERFNVKVGMLPCGTTVIDAGLHTPGGILAGMHLALITLGNRAQASIEIVDYENLRLPAITVAIDQPAIPTLASQMAGWQIKCDDFMAMGSGPARALAQKPKDVYQQLGYVERDKHAVLALEGQMLPTEQTAKLIAEKAGIETANLVLIIAPTNSIAGSVQIAARSVEIPVLRLFRLGLPPTSIISGWGRGSIATVHPKNTKMMGRTNDVLLYGGSAVLVVDPPENIDLKSLSAKAVSMVSKDYGRPFYDIFKAANWDFYAVDESLFGIAELCVNNTRTGETIHAGKINVSVLKESLAYSSP